VLVVEKGTVPAVTKATSKRKLVLRGARSTPKKARGTLAIALKIPQTEAHITLLVDKIKDHSQAIWGDIENTQREILVGIVEHIAEL